MNMFNGRLDTSKTRIGNQWDRTKDYTEYTTENQRDRKYESEVNFDGDILSSFVYILLEFQDEKLEKMVVFAKLCPTLYSTPNFHILHYHLEFAQTHVLWVSDVIQSSCTLLPPSPPALNLSQHQGLFQWVSSFHQVPKVLELQLQH